jgi:hypothetical protein
MTIDFSQLLNDVDVKLKPHFEWPELHLPSINDIEKSPPMAMALHCSDACPMCGGHNMRVGDYVCWGYCYGCVKEAFETSADR